LTPGTGSFQAAKHYPDHGKSDERNDGSRVALEVARQSAKAADSRQRALDDPPLGLHLETWHWVALDDLQAPASGLCRLGLLDLPKQVRAGSCGASEQPARKSPETNTTAAWNIRNRPHMFFPLT